MEVLNVLAAFWLATVAVLGIYLFWPSSCVTIEVDPQLEENALWWSDR